MVIAPSKWTGVLMQHQCVYNISPWNCNMLLHISVGVERAWRIVHLWLQFLVVRFLLSTSWNMSRCFFHIFYSCTCTGFFSVLFFFRLYISVWDSVIPRGAVSLLRRKVAGRSSGKRISLFRLSPLPWTVVPWSCVCTVLAAVSIDLPRSIDVASRKLL
jgi:hypothetical protein